MLCQNFYPIKEMILRRFDPDSKKERVMMLHEWRLQAIQSHHYAYFASGTPNYKVPIQCANTTTESGFTYDPSEFWLQKKHESEAFLEYFMERRQVQNVEVSFYWYTISQSLFSKTIPAFFLDQICKSKYNIIEEKKLAKELFNLHVKRIEYLRSIEKTITFTKRKAYPQTQKVKDKDNKY